jgi:hypothetical protein
MFFRAERGSGINRINQALFSGLRSGITKTPEISSCKMGNITFSGNLVLKFACLDIVF